MAIFKRVPKSELGTRFSHKGWFLFCPIYIDNPDVEGPELVERNWVPEWVLLTAYWVFAFNVLLFTRADPLYEPMFPIYVTGEIKADQ